MNNDSDNDSGGSDDGEDGTLNNVVVNTERTLSFNFYIKKTITRSNRVAIFNLWDQRMNIGRKSFSCQAFANVCRKENSPSTLILTMRIGSKMKEKKWNFATSDDATRFHQVLNAMGDHGLTLRSGFETLDKRRSGLILAKDLQGTIKRIEGVRISIDDANAMLLSVNTDSFVIQTLSHTMGVGGSSSNNGGVNVRALFLYFIQSRFRDTKEMLFEWRNRSIGRRADPAGHNRRGGGESTTDDDDRDDSSRNSSICWMNDEKPPLLCKGEKVLNIVQNVNFGIITQSATTPSIGNLYLSSYRLIFNAYFKQPAMAMFCQMSATAVSSALRNSICGGVNLPIGCQPSLRREVPDCLTEVSIPLNSVVSIEKSKTDATGILIDCKDFKTIKLVFEGTNAQFLESIFNILNELCFPNSIDQLFAFKHLKDYIMTSASTPPVAAPLLLVTPLAISAIRPATSTPPPVGAANLSSRVQTDSIMARSVSISAIPSYLQSGWDIFTVQKEFTRQGVLPSELWRIWSDNYRLVDTYPREFIVPAHMSDSEILSKKRLPALTWRNPYNGTLLARSSQPMVGVSGARCFADEKLLSLYRVRGNPHDLEEVENPSEFFIFDARKPIAATGNQIQGKGTEKIENYEMSRLLFCNIENIHAMRSSIHLLVDLLAETKFDDDNPTKFYAKLEDTLWLKHLRGIISSSIQIAEKLILESASVLVHCSDGWDRTAQLVATVQLLLDPYFRTVEGFGVLVEKDWCQFGHKFQQRIGHAEARPTHEISPIFVQWLDVCHQIMVQFPTSFEFNEDLLIFLADHLYSGLYGNFLGNNDRQRVVDLGVREKSVSIWSYVNHYKSSFLNPHYTQTCIGAIWPSVGIGRIVLWERYYCAWNSDVHPRAASGIKWKHDWGAGSFDGSESRADSNSHTTRTYVPIQRGSTTHSTDGVSAHSPPPRPTFLKTNFFNTERTSPMQRSLSFLPLAHGAEDDD